MDDKDLKIIKMLQLDARTSYLDIAKSLGMSESAVRKRVKRLESEGVIEKYTVLVNPSKLGYNAVAIIGLDVIPEKFLEVVKALAQLEDVKSVVTSTGDHMIMIEVWAHNNQELTDIILQKIGKINGIVRICPSIILERIK